jgi:hypothetical protein
MCIPPPLLGNSSKNVTAAKSIYEATEESLDTSLSFAVRVVSKESTELLELFRILAVNALAIN